ncbi:MAG: hypothetical protein AAGI66_03500, partial [Cyanobacteria bacterium P01_H01_bin.74]
SLRLQTFFKWHSLQGFGCVPKGQEATGCFLLLLKGVQRKRDVSSGAKGSLGERAQLSPDKVKEENMFKKILL